MRLGVAVTARVVPVSGPCQQHPYRVEVGNKTAADRSDGCARRPTDIRVGVRSWECSHEQGRLEGALRGEALACRY